MANSRLTIACSRPATAPRSEWSGACVASLGGVDLPVVVSGLWCSGKVVATRLPRCRAQDAGGLSKHWYETATDTPNHEAYANHC